MNPDEIRYAMKNLMNRKMRSWLTVLSILIGVMAIFAIVSFGLGIQKYMDVLAREAGTDKLYIQARSIGAPGTDENFYLSKSDIEYVGKIKGVKEYAEMYMSAAEIKSDKQAKYSFIIAWDRHKNELVLESFTVGILKGRGLENDEMGKVTLGYLYQFDNKIFKKGLKLGDKVEINGEKFEVVGFYEEVGNPSDDANIYITNKQFEALFPDQKDHFGFAMLQSDQGVDPEDLADKIQDKLRKHKGQEEGKEDFYVQTFADAIATFGTVINILNGVLALIALVSMIVASVNIMNTMYTAVLERTKEIGIMKAIGARNSDIMFIFILESGVLGMVGGIIGVLFGYGIAKMGGAIAASSGFGALQPAFPWYLTLGCILFAFFTGAIAGVLPARHASRLNPVDALRVE